MLKSTNRPDRTTIKIIAAALGVLILYFFIYDDKVVESSGKTDCDIQNGACIKMLSEDIIAEFDISPKPVKSMTGHTFILRLKKGDVPVRDATVTLDLNMPGMYMGDNKTLLVHRQDGTYEGNGIIVRCPSGKKIWEAAISVKIPHAEETVETSANYIFKVAQ